MDDLEFPIDLGPENERQLSRLRRALILGGGFQLVLVEVPLPELALEVERRLAVWSGTDSIPNLTFVDGSAGDPIAALDGATSGAVLTGLDPILAPARPAHAAVDAINALNWSRDALPSLVKGPLILILSPDGSRELFAHAPDLYTWRRVSTRLTPPRPEDLQVRPVPDRRAAREEKAWLERMISKTATGPLARGLPGWLIRLGEIEARDDRVAAEHSFARAQALADGRRDVLFRLALARARHAQDESRLDDAKTFEDAAAEQVSDLSNLGDWESRAFGRSSDVGPSSHEAVFAELRTVRAERLLRLGAVDDAATVAVAALRAARSSGERSLILAALAVSGAIARHLGHRRIARGHFHELRSIARMARDREAELLATLELSELTADEASSSRLLEEATSLLSEEDHDMRARVALGIARQALGNGQLAEAERALSDIGEVERFRCGLGLRVLLARGGVATATEDHSAALAHYRSAVKLLGEGPPSRRRARVWLLLGDAARSAGDHSVAVEAYDRTLELAHGVADEPTIAAATHGKSLEAGPPAGPPPPDVERAKELLWPIERRLPPRARVAPDATDPALAALESTLAGLDVPGDSPERLAQLEQLARVYGERSRNRDAAACMVRAIWELPSKRAREALDAWRALEVGGRDETIVLQRALGVEAPGADDLGAVAALAAAGAPAVASNPQRVRTWLERFGRGLEVRALWLARLGLAAMFPDGDAPGLRHTRDLVLSRLAEGDVERELPSFLQGPRGGPTENTAEAIEAGLERLFDVITSTRRKRSPIEAPLVYTAAFINFQFAFGWANVGAQGRARFLADHATATLRPFEHDPVFDYLVGAFRARIDQVVARQFGAPLPPALRDRLSALGGVMRYKVDRLREASRILEPFERPDALGAFSAQQYDTRGREFQRFDLLDPSARIAELHRLVVTASDGAGDPLPPVERARLLRGVLESVRQMPEDNAVPLLELAITGISSLHYAGASLFGLAIEVAGHFDRVELIPGLLQRLKSRILDTSPFELGASVDQSLSALRRAGMRQEIVALLSTLEDAANATSSVDHPFVRGAIARGHASIGNLPAALPILESMRETLRSDQVKPVDRRELTRVLARGYASTPVATAIAAILDLAADFHEISDSYGTNTHFCLSVLHFTESLVLALASDTLRFGDGRRLVEDDEYLIRRRLRRDLDPSTQT